MERVYLIAIAFLAPCYVTATQNVTIDTIQDVRCPPVDTCPPTLFFHENDCSMYYECSGGRPQLRHCASGLFFSKKWQGCVAPDISECNRDEGDNCRNGELSKHECQCTKFYECRDGWKVLQECSSGSYFNETVRQCRKGTNCKDDIEAECVEGEKIRHECQCEKYYVCKNGRKALRDCPAGEGFNPNTRSCEKDFCGHPGCANGETRIHECRCDRYYTCKNKDWVLRNCPAGQHFSPKRLRCMPKREAGCEHIKPDECSRTDDPWRHECDCRLYYVCPDGRKEIKACRWGDYFDSRTRTCYSAKVITDCRNDWDDWLDWE